MLLLAAGVVRSSDAPEPSPLLANASRNEALPAGQHQDYLVALPAGSAVDLSLQQTGDTGLELRWAEQGKAFGSPLRNEAGRQATIRLTLVADRARQLLIRVAPTATDTRYSIALKRIHPATAADRSQAAAAQLVAQADELRSGHDPAKQEQARSLYQQASRQWQSARGFCGLRAALVAQSNFEHDFGNSPAQQSTAHEALSQTCPDDKAEQALAWRLLGSAYNNQGDYAAAASATEHAVTLFHATGDLRNEGTSLGNLGLAYGESGQTGKALSTAKAALKIAEDTHNGKLLVFVRNSIAFMHLTRGELATAAEAYQQTLGDLQTTPYPMVETVAWINLGFIYHQLGDIDQAYQAYAKAEAMARSIECWSCLAEVLADKGDDLLDDGKTSEAAAIFQQALDLSKAHQLPRQQAEALRGLGRCATAAGDWDRARTLLEDALQQLHQTHGLTNEAHGYTALGDLENRLGHFPAAEQDYQKALDLALQSAEQNEQTVALASLARIREAVGDHAAARHYIEEAIDHIESERAQINDPSLRSSYFSSMRSYYALYIDILMQLEAAHPGQGNAAAALETAERARARSLHDLLAQRTITVDPDIDPTLTKAERDDEDRLSLAAYRRTQLPAKATPAQRLQAQKTIDEASRELDHARGRVRAADPRYAELAHPAVMHVAEMQRLLGTDTVLLEYWLGQKQSYLWCVGHDSIQTFVLPAGSTLDTLADSLRQQLTTHPVHDAGSIAPKRAAAQALARVALDPVRGAATAKKWVVVADGKLQWIPFGFLDKATAQGPPVVGDREINYLPSIQTVTWLRNPAHNSAAHAQRLAILADPVFDAADQRLQIHSHHSVASSRDASLLSATGDPGIANLPRLSYSRQEAEQIAAEDPSHEPWVALDFAANRKAVQDAHWQDYSIVHFATHALLDSRHPELSGIVLSLFDEQGHPRDGFLRMNDIYGLKMPADLVVLSACDTALGPEGGEGSAYALARAFFYAGARRVVASQWSVDDQATAEFMRYFYQSLLVEKHSAAAALVTAQHHLAANPRWQSPYYWAGFVVQGDWQ